MGLLVVLAALAAAAAERQCEPEGPCVECGAAESAEDFCTETQFKQRISCRDDDAQEGASVVVTLDAPCAAFVDGPRDLVAFEACAAAVLALAVAVMVWRKRVHSMEHARRLEERMRE